MRKDPIIKNGAARITAVFRDADGNLTDLDPPVNIWVERPDETVDGPFVMAHLSTGTYRYDYETHATSRHKWHIEDSADKTTVAEGVFHVWDTRLSVEVNALRLAFNSPRNSQYLLIY